MSDYNFLTFSADTVKLQRNQNAGKKTANFLAPWQLGVLTGSALGGIKGGLEQDNTREIGAGERLLKVGTNALAGGALGGGLGAGIPQIAQESKTVARSLDSLERNTGLNLAPETIKPTFRENIQRAQEETIARRQQRRINRQNVIDRVLDVPRTIVDTAKQDTGRVIQGLQDANAAVEAKRDAIINAGSGTVNAVGAGVGGVLGTAIAPGVGTVAGAGLGAKGAQDIQEALRIAKNRQLRKQAAVQVRRQLQTPATAEQGLQTAAAQAIEANKANDIIADATTPSFNEQLGQTLKNRALGDTRKTQNFLSNLTGGRIPQAKYSYMYETSNFTQNPYFTGTAIGAGTGAVAGGVIGLGTTIKQNAQEEQDKLDRIQSIQDPYARKQEYDIYDDDLSRVGRTVGYGVKTGGNTALSAGVGAVGGGLLGGAGYLAYKNIQNGNHNIVGRKGIDRGRALSILLSGKQYV